MTNRTHTRKYCRSCGASMALETGFYCHLCQHEIANKPRTVPEFPPLHEIDEDETETLPVNASEIDHTRPFSAAEPQRYWVWKYHDFVNGQLMEGGIELFPPPQLTPAQEARLQRMHTKFVRFMQGLFAELEDKG